MVAHVDGIALDSDAGKPAGELVAIHPVRRGAPAIEEAGLGQDEGARAEPNHPPRARRRPREPAEKIRVAPGIVGLVDARHDERVDVTADGPVRAVAGQAQARPLADRGHRRHDLDRVTSILGEPHIGGVEDVEGTADLDDLATGHGNHDHTSRSHRHLLRPALPGNPLSHLARMSAMTFSPRILPRSISPEAKGSAHRRGAGSPGGCARPASACQEHPCVIEFSVTMRIYWPKPTPIVRVL